MRKKSPKKLNEQYVRITDYLMRESWKNGAPSREEREKVCKKIEKLRAIYNRYVDNIYKLHNVDPWKGNVAEVNDIWANDYHTKEEYMNI